MNLGGGARFSDCAPSRVYTTVTPRGGDRRLELKGIYNLSVVPGNSQDDFLKRSEQLFPVLDKRM